jgi:glutaredoxin
MDVTVFSKAGCGGCVATKANLKKRGIEYHEVRVDQNAEALAAFQRAGFSGVPVVMAFRNDEDEVPDVITGFHTTLIDALGKDGDIPDAFATG